jgi:hypothetical protein
LDFAEDVAALYDSATVLKFLISLYGLQSKFHCRKCYVSTMGFYEELGDPPTILFRSTVQNYVICTNNNIILS